MTEWIEAESGLTCQTVNFRGHWNGYVKVPTNHQMCKKQYNECVLPNQCPTDAPLSPYNGVPYYSCEHTPERILDVHGGVTFTGTFPRSDGTPDPDSDWWIGFDTAHYGDEGILEDYVISETESLARQLV